MGKKPDFIVVFEQSESSTVMPADGNGTVHTHTVTVLCQTPPANRGPLSDMAKGILYAILVAAVPVLIWMAVWQERKTPPEPLLIVSSCVAMFFFIRGLIRSVRKLMGQ